MPKPARKPEPAVSDGDAVRGLPHDLDAERSVLGAILVHNDAYDAVAPLLLDGHYFYRQAHRLIWSAITDLAEGGHVAVDFVTLKDQLDRRGELEEVGGPAYVASLSDGVPRATNAKHYAGIVREKGMLRDLIYTANYTLTAAYDGDEDSSTILSSTERRLLAIQHEHTGRLESLQTSSLGLLNRIAHRVDHRGELRGLTTGFPRLDELTLGWKAGELIVPAARTSVGKTAFLLNTVAASAKTGARWGLFSFEMERDELLDRLLAMEVGIDAHRIRGGHLGDPDMEKVSAAIETLHTLPIHIDDRSRLTIQEVRTECRILLANDGLSGIAIDYMQEMPGSLTRKGATRTEELTDIAKRAKDLAKELRVPVVMLSQLLEGPGRPTLNDLRECRALAQSADIVALLHRKDARASGPTELLLRKQRNGPTGSVPLEFDRDTQRFTPGQEPDTRATDAEAEEKPAPRRRRRAGRPWFGGESD